MNKRILIVEDEKNIVDILSFNLSKEGYETLEAYDGEAGLQLALEQNPDLILLDLMLPKMNGFDVCRSLRRENRSTPVIMLTAREEETDKVLGLELGADDYITKPFSPKELVLRVNNVIKRVYKDDNNRIMVDGYELDEEQRKVFDHGVEIDLTTKEFDLLMLFIKNKGMAFNRDKILTSVWEENYFGSDRVVDDTLRRLRKKLPNLNIHTIYGYGYRLG